MGQRLKATILTCGGRVTVASGFRSDRQISGFIAQHTSPGSRNTVNYNLSTLSVSVVLALMVGHGGIPTVDSIRCAILLFFVVRTVRTTMM